MTEQSLLRYCYTLHNARLVLPIHFFPEQAYFALFRRTGAYYTGMYLNEDMTLTSPMDAESIMTLINVLSENDRITIH